MRIPQRWLDSAPIRYILTVTGFRRNNAHKEYEFEPYFQYKIGPYATDYTLYFATRPSKSIYHREIFAKMVEYYGSGLIEYLDYHYKAYAGKKEFLRFLKYETLDRLSSSPTTEYRSLLGTTLEWVKEEEEALVSLAAAASADFPTTTPSANSQLPDDVSMDAAMNALVGAFPGKIELNNQLNIEKYTQVQILMKGLMSPGRNGEYLFKRCSDSDLAAMLHHFEHLGDLKLNTLQKKVAEARKHLDLNDPKVEKLRQALQEFFYQ